MSRGRPALALPGHVAQEQQARPPTAGKVYATSDVADVRYFYAVENSQIICRVSKDDQWPGAFQFEASGQLARFISIEAALLAARSWLEGRMGMVPVVHTTPPPKE